METGLAGKRVLVTGASGGIGGACAREFAREGSRVVVHYHEGRERAEALRRACAAGAIAASRFGAQPSLPTADEVDAILRR